MQAVILINSAENATITTVRSKNSSMTLRLTGSHVGCTYHVTSPVIRWLTGYRFDDEMLVFDRNHSHLFTSLQTAHRIRCQWCAGTQSVFPFPPIPTGQFPSHSRVLIFLCTFRGGSKGGGGQERPRPLVKILPPPHMCPPMKFMIKHNLPLVRGGSLWQYRYVAPAAIMATPLLPPKM